MTIHSRQLLLLSVLLGSLIASSAQAGSPRFGGGQGLRGAASRFSNKFSHSGSGSGTGMQAFKNQATQTLSPSARPSISTMDAIKASNFASDVKSRLKNHQFEPSTMDVIKAKNFASDVKDRVLNPRFEPSTMDVIKASNALSDLKSKVKGRLLND